MRHPAKALLFSVSFGISAALKQACPLNTPQYLVPDSLSTEPEFQAVAKQFDSTIDEYVKKGSYEGLTFSAGVFSTTSEDLLWQYHHASPGLKNSTQGAKDVDADSIYRIGSISKMLSMYLFLIYDGDRSFNEPITKYLPALTEYASQSSQLISNWDEITVGDLAGQMAGLGRDYGLADLAVPNNTLVALPPAIAKAFPKLPDDQIPICGSVLPDGTLDVCTNDEYVQGVATEAPIFNSAYTPVYSNEAFALIGLALENITGLSFEQMFHASLVDALGLPGTYYSTPSAITAHDVIPGTPKATGWEGEFGPFAPAGAFYSSTNDFKTIGQAILSSKLIPKIMTNRWFKPSSFVEDYSQGVGRPWEIFRRKINGASVEIFVKGGDWGVYHTFFALVPTYSVGFTVFTGDDEGGALDGLHDPDAGIPNVVLDKLLTALDNIANKQTLARFGGTYTLPSSNSSVTIGNESTNTGLLVTSWVSNGVDLFTWLESLQPNLVLRILPNQLNAGENKVAFTSFYWSAEAPPNETSVWYWNCPTWIDVDEVTLGNVPLGQMVFDVGDDGAATAVEVRSLRTTLQKQS